ncbi:phosphate transport system protein [Clostridium saccharoperbutylacetonicum]|jgi:phosphate transport system protein|uniref:Phosphate-specific transport system accessory protein PhoU n=1 Tax=Clostridium saccharoperbutylacetonicum N1-4(HMT) TaxID=931276 RepID=M1MU15_9CLOT|nr:phosphate signaling complex protein PhoU [Clostridium saccharoperbutylacetonicum]AGF55042.1 phosphate transport system protein PhoU [Clostridium saccharoperbutylacetonicum N1-4(HMT)]NRT64249.1 phosphate transport system protein [Clostridium saccharoperbutylacetonicum]NSB41105.1 phosphate transport system protein [Clostridium saccharoperbutylacetonicum]
MTRGSQDTRVKIINRELVTMSSLVEKQIYESLLCLKNYDVEKAKQVIKDDDKVDDMQKKIEEECIKYIATEQPLATDLRRVFTASKIVTDLERMADHAVDVCKITKRIGGSISNNKEILEQLMSMESKVRSMLKAAIEAHINEDSELAYKICEKDDEIDAVYKSLFSALVNAIKVDETLIEKGTQLLFVIKYLERIGDHITNICEWTIFSKTGAYVDLNE